jgi:hypothetical protein
MLVAAALVPDTALLVPGAAGSAAPVDALRAAALEAVRDATAGPVERVVVVAAGPADRVPREPVRATLAPVGVPDHLLAEPVPHVVAGVLRTDAAGTGGEVPTPGTAVALHLLAAAGWRGPVRLVEVARPTAAVAGSPRAAELGRRGAELVADGATALVVVGSASGRHGPDAPLADDDRAPAHDARVLADLAAADEAARTRLAGDDPALAAALAVTGWAPWQVLVGAADGATVDARLLRAEVVAGAQHAVLAWRCR